MGEVNGDESKHCFVIPLKLPCPKLVNSFNAVSSNIFIHLLIYVFRLELMKILSEHGRNLHEFEEDAGTFLY